MSHDCVAEEGERYTEVRTCDLLIWLEQGELRAGDFAGFFG
jgi:hypothetical protein